MFFANSRRRTLFAPSANSHRRALAQREQSPQSFFRAQRNNGQFSNPKPPHALFGTKKTLNLKHQVDLEFTPGAKNLTHVTPGGGSEGGLGLGSGAFLERAAGDATSMALLRPRSYRDT